MVFWAASYLRDNLSLRSATATALAGAFLAGMALGRAGVVVITRLTKTIEATIQLARRCRTAKAFPSAPPPDGREHGPRPTRR